jgi:hypothetical protein
MKLVTAFVVAVSLATACDKGGDSSKGGGALSSAEADMFKSLPSAPVAFGGNYMKLQSFMQTTLGKGVASLAKGMKEWMDCFAAIKDTKVAGVATLAGKTPEIRLIFGGADIKDFAGCADKAGFKQTTDPDGKFISIEIPGAGMAASQTYLKLPNGGIYMRQAMGGMVKPTGTTRAELEADIAAVAKGGTAADDAKLAALMQKVDRSKTIWFVGNAAGTPLADKIGEAYGSLEILPGLSLDVTVQVIDESVNKQVDQMWSQVKSAKDQLPGEMKSLIDAIELTHNGDRVHLVAKLTDAQLKSAMSMMSMFGRGMGGM